MQVAQGAEIDAIGIACIHAAGGAALAEVLDMRVFALTGARLEHQAGGRLAVPGQMAAVQAIVLQGLAQIVPETVVAHAAQPADVKAQAGEADGDVGVGPGDTALVM